MFSYLIILGAKKKVIILSKLQNMIIKSNKTSFHAANFEKEGFERYFKKNFYNTVFSAFEKTTKKDFIKSLEIKKHEELKGERIGHHWNKNLCKINEKWYNLTDIKAITLKEFLIKTSKEGYAIIADIERKSFAIIAGYMF